MATIPTQLGIAEQITQIDADITNMLDIGCGNDANLVWHLREKGIDAIGVDIDFDHIPDEPFLYPSTAKVLERFGEESFDLITSVAVLSLDATYARLFYNNYYNHVLLDSEFIKHAKPNIDRFAKTNAIQILEDAHRLLRPGKHFLGILYEREQLLITPKDAQDIGYKVLEYAPTQILLQKP